ncbi:MAG: hypothetical protein ABNH38_17985 [Tateyamaria sp.]|jgi:hypothetical protein|uniref:hypothetical protein n=1 Tax=Tateyamaria sp. TaxID=1929288 RepID=UPI0032DCA858
MLHTICSTHLFALNTPGLAGDVTAFVGQLRIVGDALPNLVAIEWEMLQHRRMRDAGVRAVMRKKICTAVVNREEAAHKAAVAEALDEASDDEDDEEDWEAPPAFDRKAAEENGDALARRADPSNGKEFTAACDEIEALGLDTTELMAEAYAASIKIVAVHEEKLQELERRRREVWRDFDALQRARPAAPDIIEGEAVET